MRIAPRGQSFFAHQANVWGTHLGYTAWSRKRVDTGIAGTSIKAQRWCIGACVGVVGGVAILQQKVMQSPHSVREAHFDTGNQCVAQRTAHDGGRAARTHHKVTARPQYARNAELIAGVASCLIFQWKRCRRYVTVRSKVVQLR